MLVRISHDVYLNARATKKQNTNKTIEDRKKNARPPVFLSAGPTGFYFTIGQFFYELTVKITENFEKNDFAKIFQFNIFLNYFEKNAISKK